MKDKLFDLLVISLAVFGGFASAIAASHTELVGPLLSLAIALVLFSLILLDARGRK